MLMVAESEKEAAGVAEEGLAAAWGGPLRKTAPTAAFRRSPSRLIYRDDAVRKKHIDGDERKYEGRERPGNEAKRIKVEGGGVKKEEEEGKVVKAERRESMEWEDATVVVAGGAKHEAEEEKVEERMDSRDWEDAGGADEPKAEDTEKHKGDNLDWEDAS